MNNGAERQCLMNSERHLGTKEVKFQVGARLTETIKGISQIKPDWNKIQWQIDSYIQNSKNNPDRKLKNNYDIYSLVSEFHVRNCIDTIVNQNNLLSDTETDNYVFKNKKDGCLNIYKKYKNQENLRHICELDSVLLVDGIFIVFEVKTSTHKEENGENLSLIKAMSDKRINHIFTPLQERFNNFGYAIVAPREVLNNSKKEQRFVEGKGGILIPFYASMGTFKSEVYSNIEISQR